MIYLSKTKIFSLCPEGMDFLLGFVFSPNRNRKTLLVWIILYMNTDAGIAVSVIIANFKNIFKQELLLQGSECKNALSIVIPVSINEMREEI